MAEMVEDERERRGAMLLGNIYNRGEVVLARVSWRRESRYAERESALTLPREREEAINMALLPCYRRHYRAVIAGVR